eukprot:CAMPEP_0181114636 /NCGR_PEP_ID=MMETSP1071-20121207/21000_1 /TAXON_ID=35127 /ORGANISM="Thalassiosira sp., Strain NH16" /LENGTH=318 /DNA_ID=CAMNT_0023198781 /DNA_START=84 /DNA_END=1040 /DNA_ORIENTATION=+
MNANGSELCFGLMLLLEAAEHHDAIMVTPPSCHKKRDIASPLTSPLSPRLCPVMPVSSGSEPFALPPKKRIKFNNFGDINDGAYLRFNPISSSGDLKFSPIKKLSKCPAGSTHRVWEKADECAMAATSVRRFNFSTTIKVAKTWEDKHCDNTRNETPFVLYDNDDDKHINALHNIVRRDIWEGFVVDASKSKVSEDTHGGKAMKSSTRRNSRLARYDGTIGFRCRFCKNAPHNQRAERSAVYPRSLEGIYLANIRFQRDHIDHCTFIPKDIKEEYSSIKNSKGISRGRKQYWVSSALRKGLSNGEGGIVFSAEGKYSE